MTARELLYAQMTDPLRVALLAVALWWVLKHRNGAGQWGEIGLAVLATDVVATLTFGRVIEGGPILRALAMGVISNLVWLGIMLLLRRLWKRIAG